ncbi:hypothetical protein [Goodfellowiella coeruleoviolacea]|uniref:VCBS repeat-containing protein n=1 Tax=Goodfellowiella coeruleoviolacea TaxID=334858 RepID=A0AAE3KI93_9PSEU|nr:hypothetical protein [Goodfellowiella coeruleoviolacea]MCP2168245.1 hypothetical protein [Goodfellowiella coeruleoviolacea]
MPRALLRAALAAGVTMSALVMAPFGTAFADSVQDVRADLNGDGVLDSARLTDVGNGWQTLVVTVGDDVVDTGIPWDAPNGLGIRPIRVTDVNGDGRQELAVSEAVGANTTTFSVWQYDEVAPLRELTTPNGQPLKLHEGGGVWERTGYECVPASPSGRLLVTLGVQHPDLSVPVYTGERVTYQVRETTAIPVSKTTLTNVPDGDPRVSTDPASCG